MSQAGTGVGLTTAGKLLPDAGAQEGVLELARTGLAPPLFPVVIPAARDEKGLAQPGYLILAAHLFVGSSGQSFFLVFVISKPQRGARWRGKCGWSSRVRFTT